jgi:Cupin domain
MKATPIILAAGCGRAYECGPMRAVFKADEAETSARYSVSERTVAPHSSGSGPHSHEENDEIFLVTEGTMMVRVGDERIEAPVAHSCVFLQASSTTSRIEPISPRPCSMSSSRVGLST